MVRTGRLLSVLSLWCLAASIAAAGRETVPVAAWSETDGARWSDVAVGELTRAAFERRYASRPTDTAAVLRGITRHRTKTSLFALFDGPGPDAHLASILCFYDTDHEAPTPADFEGAR